MGQWYELLSSHRADAHHSRGKFALRLAVARRGEHHPRLERLGQVNLGGFHLFRSRRGSTRMERIGLARGTRVSTNSDAGRHAYPSSRRIHGRLAAHVDLFRRHEQCAFFAERWLAAARLQARSEEHTSELPSLMRISYSVFCLKKKNK